MPENIKPRISIPKPIKILQADGSVKKGQLIVYKFKSKQGGVTINSIKERAKEIKAKLTAQNVQGKIQTGLSTPMGFRSGKITDIASQDIDLWDPTLYNYDALDADKSNEGDWYDNGEGKVKSFFFYVQYTGETMAGAGADDDFNDCVYKALCICLGEKVVKKWAKPSSLKRALRIDRRAQVSFEHVDKIEQWLNVQIFISGDHVRLPKTNAKQSIYLCLKQNHITVDKTHLGKKQRAVSYRERLPLTYHYATLTDSYIAYGRVEGDTDVEHHSFSTTEIRQMLAKPISSPYVLVKVKDKRLLEQEYHTFVREGKALKHITKDKINIFKSGNIKNTALDLFTKNTKNITADPIHSVEGQWILSAYRGGMRYGKAYEGILYAYDITSMYPGLLQSACQFPYKEGRFLRLTQEEMDTWKDKNGQQYFKFGIYTAEIRGDIDKRLFRVSPDNRYTHIDLTLAHKYGYTINLLQINECNFLFYPPETRLAGNALFKEYIDTLYPIKNNHKELTYPKKLLNILWGALAEGKVSSRIYTSLKDNDPITLQVGEEITNFKDYGKKRLRIECVNTCDMFVSGYARISPFLTAMGRSQISTLIHENMGDNLNYLIRVHTDSIYSTKPLKKKYDTKGACKLGELAYEGWCEHATYLELGRKVQGQFSF